MQAIRVEEFGGPDVLRVREIENPSPGRDEVLVEIRAVGVNPVDTYIRAGARGGSLPFTPGMDGAGLIAAVGEEVTEWKVGDRVFTCRSITGTYAEYALCHKDQVQPLPEKISFEQGAGLFVPYGTAYAALVLRGYARPGETVLVHGGSGGVGTATIQFAAARGCTVIATAGTERGLQLVREQGAHYAFSHNDPNYLKSIMDLTGGVHLVIEMLANVNLQRDIELLRPRGRIVVVGSRGTIEIDPRSLMSKNGTVTGMTLLEISDEERSEIYAAIGAGLKAEILAPIVGRSFPLSEAAAAHSAILEPGSYGKIVLLP